VCVEDFFVGDCFDVFVVVVVCLLGLLLGGWVVDVDCCCDCFGVVDWVV